MASGQAPPPTETPPRTAVVRRGPNELAIQQITAITEIVVGALYPTHANKAKAIMHMLTGGGVDPRVMQAMEDSGAIKTGGMSAPNTATTLSGDAAMWAATGRGLTKLKEMLESEVRGSGAKRAIFIQEDEGNELGGSKVLKTGHPPSGIFFPSAGSSSSGARGGSGAAAGLEEAGFASGGGWEALASGIAQGLKGALEQVIGGKSKSVGDFYNTDAANKFNPADFFKQLKTPQTPGMVNLMEHHNANKGQSPFPTANVLSFILSPESESGTHASYAMGETADWWRLKQNAFKMEHTHAMLQPRTEAVVTGLERKVFQMTVQYLIKKQRVLKDGGEPMADLAASVLKQQSDVVSVWHDMVHDCQRYGEQGSDSWVAAVGGMLAGVLGITWSKAEVSMVMRVMQPVQGGAAALGVSGLGLRPGRGSYPEGFGEVDAHAQAYGSGMQVAPMAQKMPTSQTIVGQIRSALNKESITCTACDKLGHEAFECPAAYGRCWSAPMPGFTLKGAKRAEAFQMVGGKSVPTRETAAAWAVEISRKRFVAEEGKQGPKPDVFVGPAT